MTVTSFKDAEQSLVACSYQAERDASPAAAGQVDYFLGKYRRVEARCDYPDGTVCLRLSSPVERGGVSQIKNRFTITHADLMAARKAFDKQRKAVLAEVAAANTLPELDAVSARAAAAGNHAYRHFDLEEIRDALAARQQWIDEKMSRDERAAYEAERQAKDEAALARWMSGEDVRQHFRAVRLRVKGDRVEVSTGQSATLAGARKALAFVLKHRQQGWARNGETFDLDAFPVHRVDARGVLVGCTQFEWSEIERFAKYLKAPAGQPQA